MAYFEVSTRAQYLVAMVLLMCIYLSAAADTVLNYWYMYINVLQSARIIILIYIYISLWTSSISSKNKLNHRICEYMTYVIYIISVLIIVMVFTLSRDYIIVRIHIRTRIADACIIINNDITVSKRVNAYLWYSVICVLL